MSWHGIGLISGNWTPLANMGQIYAPLPESIQPSAQWNGTAGSGFGGSNPAAPSDPTRTTAKPALRLLVPPYQFFTDTLDVGVIAAANDGGTLINNLGIASVKFMFEGSEAVVTAPRWHTFQTQRGAKTYFGWWVRLKKPAGTAGNGQLYVEATARDATMQKRVIGPYLFSPVDQQYTASVTVAPSQPEVAGVSYQTLNAAATYLNGTGTANPLITIVEAGAYELTVGTVTPLATNRRTKAGYLNITASVPGVVIGRGSYTTDAAARIDNARYKTHFFGSNLTLDFRRVINQIGDSTDIGQGSWVDGVNLISTAPNGAWEPWRGTFIPAVLGLFTGGAWLTEVEATDVTNVGIAAALVRGGNFDRIAYDMFNTATCVVGTRTGLLTSSPISDDINAFTVQYTGGEATATLARSGGQLSTTDVIWTVTIGATAYTFDTGPANPGNVRNEQYFNGTLGDGYWVSDVVDWLNTLPDVTATLQLDEADSFELRCASTCSLPNTQSAGFAATDIKAAPLQVVASVPYHPDWYQHNGDFLENVIVAFNTVREADAQLIFLSPFKSGATTPYEYDVFFIGNALGAGTTTHPGAASSYELGAFSQFGRGTGMVASHVVIAHNTTNQGMFVRTSGIVNGSTADEYCGFYNNALRTFVYDAAGPLPDLVIDKLHLHSGNAAPANATNVVIGGDRTSLYVDFEAGDLRPAGVLVENGFAPVVPFDMDRVAFPSPAALGAYAFAAPEYVPPPPPTDPLADLITAMNLAGGQSLIHRLRNASVTGGVWRSEDMSVNNNDLTQSTPASQPVINATGATFDNGDRLNRAITGGTFTVIMGFTKADASTAATILCDQSSANVVQYAQGISSAPGSTVLIDGNPIASRNALYLALHQTGAKVIEMQGCNFTGDTQISLGRGGGTSLVGTVDWFIVIEEAAFPDTLSQMRSWAKQVAASA